MRKDSARGPDVGCYSKETDISNLTALHRSVLLHGLIVPTLTLLNGAGKEAHALTLWLTELRCRLFQRCAGRRKMGMWQDCHWNRNHGLSLRSSYCALLPFISRGNLGSGISAAPLPVYVIIVTTIIIVIIIFFIIISSGTLGWSGTGRMRLFYT